MRSLARVKPDSVKVRADGECHPLSPAAAIRRHSRAGKGGVSRTKCMLSSRNIRYD
jgi:hypothetical protein